MIHYMLLLGYILVTCYKNNIVTLHVTFMLYRRNKTCLLGKVVFFSVVKNPFSRFFGYLRSLFFSGKKHPFSRFFGYLKSLFRLRSKSIRSLFRLSKIAFAVLKIPLKIHSVAFSVIDGYQGRFFSHFFGYFRIIFGQERPRKMTLIRLLTVARSARVLSTYRFVVF